MRNVIVWKDIKGFEGRYQISNLGQVKSLQDGSLKKLRVAPNGYIKCQLWVKGRLFHRYVHRLVAEHFLANWSDDLAVDHIDGNRSNNRADNLEMVTTSENSLRGFRRAGKKRGAYLFRGKWLSSINKVYIGVFATKEEAHEAYRLKYIELYGCEPW